MNNKRIVFNRIGSRIKYFILLFIFISYTIFLAFSLRGEICSNLNGKNYIPSLADRPFTEDGFYMMTAAWNIAEGNGIKYNLNRPTTGIQPLFTFIQAAVAKMVLISGGNKTDFLRALIIFSSLIFIFFGYTAAKIIQHLVPPAITKIFPLFLAWFSFDLYAYFNNGLETGFYLLMIALCIYYSLKFLDNPGYKSAGIFGVLCGLTALTRIDFILPASIYFSLILINKKAEVKKIIIAGSAAVILILPWIFYVYTVSGSIFPTSVSAQASFISGSNLGGRSYGLLNALLQHFSPFIYSYNIYLCLILSLIFYLLFAFYAKKFYFISIFGKQSLNNFRLWGISFLSLPAAYFIFSFAYYFYDRYTVPVYLFIFIIISSFSIFIFSKYYIQYRKFFLAGFLLLFFVQAFYYQLMPKSPDTFALRAGFIKKHFEDTRRIGLFQSGTAGFFNENVLNLDGKMDHVAGNYALNGKIERFIDSMKIDVLIEWRDAFENFNKEYFKKNWKLYKNDIGDGRTACYVRLSKNLKEKN